MAKFAQVENSAHKVQRFAPHRMAAKGQAKRLNKARMRGRRGIRK